MFCPKCNTENKNSAKFCRACGTPLNGANAAKDDIFNSSSSSSSFGDDNRNIIIIALAIILAAALIVGAIAVTNSNNNSDTVVVEDSNDDDSSVSSDESTTTTAEVESSLSILGGTISTGSSLSDKTYCTVYVGSEHAGENVKISVLYSRGGSNLNQGKIVSKKVDSSGYVSVASAYAFEYYPDTALITIYDSAENVKDTLTVNLATQSGSQTF